MNSPICPYCNKQSKPATGADIYKHRPDLYDKKFYLCEPCNAYVGCHAESGEPFGTLANTELRKARNAAHAAFDPLWKEYGWQRNRLYQVLADEMKIERDACHIGKFDVQQCCYVVGFATRQVKAIHNEWFPGDGSQYSGLEPDCLV